MPTMILTLAWLVTSTFPALAPSPAPSSLAAIVAPAVLVPTLLADPGDTDQDQPNWLLFESDNDEERDDTDDAGLLDAASPWAAPACPFGVATSNPHPTVLPRSALRSPILRC